MSELVDLVQRLVSINSINPDLVPGGAGEAGIAQFVAGWLGRAGLEVTWDEPRPGRPNVIGVARGAGDGHSLLFNAHMDTVGIEGMERPHEPYVENGRLYGRGAYDMKGGLAAIMLAGAAARKRQLHGDVIVTAVADEEYASIGTCSIVKQWRADAAIVTEPTELDICIAHKGFAWFDVETEGMAAHGSRPDLGVDAIVKMGKVLVGLETLNKALGTGPAHRVAGRSSIHAGLIGGGQELSSYPRRCKLSIERRTIPGEILQQIEGELPGIFAQIAADDPQFKATVKTMLVRDAFEVSLAEPIVQTLRRHARALLKREPQEVGGPGWMDSALLAAAGIPTVVFGPGGAGAHAIVEWSELAQVERAVEILTAVIEDFCA